MPIDYGSLLLAVAIAAAGLSVTLFVSWLSSRADSFMLSWAVGGAFVVTGSITYGLYTEQPSPGLGMIALGSITVGLAVVLGAAFHFRHGRLPMRFTVITGAAVLVAVLLPFALGYDGLSLIVANFLAFLLLAATANVYWLARAEAPASIAGLALLYAITGISFALCGAVLVGQGQLRIGYAPDNWAEDLLLIVAIVGLTGIGALSLALNQSRLARSHRQDALTDPLTGLVNRRALFDRDSASEMSPGSAVLVFDLDHFKAINDHFGHAVGDIVIRRFAEVMRKGLRATDSAARLGGEEFAVVLRNTTGERASALAERIRGDFADAPIEAAGDLISATVSVGVAFVPLGGYRFDAALSLADEALYAAKRNGRNCVVRTEAGRGVNKETMNANSHRSSQLAR
ncbi:MAG: GGDEF domain-containing protein [Bauldia sp.]